MIDQISASYISLRKPDCSCKQSGLLTTAGSGSLEGGVPAPHHFSTDQPFRDLKTRHRIKLAIFCLPARPAHSSALRLLPSVEMRPFQQIFVTGGHFQRFITS
ncbi:hypothetical protein AVEN_14538-1 [Araneus ventricosus]|uniref:Uncharacterized protein n=1 Tax=Araneus ventricosus TaxID=182803 RepID=A0A4Y2CGE7_ARAVE|nr:hypothetical protein AVEN_14538-1 [Araneus ventricosus]